jgi:hypothetical protein
MRTLLSFLPFLLFAILGGPFGETAALAVAALAAAALIAGERRAGRQPKLLEVGGAVLFALLFLVAFFRGGTLPPGAIRLAVDLGLFAIVAGSILAGRPFTIQYAKESVPEEFWDHPRFRRVNYLISGAWAAAFAVMVAAEATMLLAPGMPRALGYGLVAAAMVGAALFTRRMSRQGARAAARQ